MYGLMLLITYLIAIYDSHKLTQQPINK